MPHWPDICGHLLENSSKDFTNFELDLTMKLNDLQHQAAQSAEATLTLFIFMPMLVLMIPLLLLYYPLRSIRKQYLEFKPHPL